MTKITNHGAAYNQMSWAKGDMGTRPTAEHFKLAHYFGRPGLEALALAQALRPEGVSRPQMLAASSAYKAAYMPARAPKGTPAYNHMRGLEAAKLLTRNLATGNKVHAYTLTEKGVAFCATCDATEASQPAKAPAKAKGDGKAPRATKPPRKPRNAPVATPAPVQAIEPVTVPVLVGPVTEAPADVAA